MRAASTGSDSASLARMGYVTRSPSVAVTLYGCCGTKKSYRHALVSLALRVERKPLLAYREAAVLGNGPRDRAGTGTQGPQLGEDAEEGGLRTARMGWTACARAGRTDLAGAVGAGDEEVATAVNSEAQLACQALRGRGSGDARPPTFGKQQRRTLPLGETMSTASNSM
jgi:hypothetical protein